MKTITYTALTALFMLFANFTPVTNAQTVSNDVLQCVADCILQEGENDRETCELRCAGLGVDMSAQPKDCMTAYKQCRKDCSGDKDCEQSCKDDLLNCV